MSKDPTKAERTKLLAGNQVTIREGRDRQMVHDGR